MSTVRAFHSTAQKIHHNDRECAAGQAITPDKLRAGTGGRDLCPECAELSRAKSGSVSYSSAAPRYYVRDYVRA